MNTANKFPYIIAIGEQKNDIKCFYIAIEKQIISVKLIIIIRQKNIFFKFLLDFMFLGTNYIQIWRGVRSFFQASPSVQYKVSSEYQKHDDFHGTLHIWNRHI